MADIELRLQEFQGDRSFALRLGEGECEEGYSCFVSVLEVPAYMIPRDILNYLGGYLNEMKAFKVYQHVEDVEKYAAIIEMTSESSMNGLIADYSGQQLSSLEGTVCQVSRVLGVGVEFIEGGSPRSGEKEKAAISDESASSSIFLDEWRSAVHAYTCPLCLESIIASLPGSPSPSPTQFRVSPRVSPLTLPGLSTRHVPTPTSAATGSSRGFFSTCCRHHFHIDCVLKLQEPQCPVCRFQHDSTTSMVSQCSTCGWRGRQNNSATSPRPSSSPFSSAGALPLPTQGTEGGSMASSDSDLWMCMVCGYVGCGHSYNFHIYSHYRETMHAYVLNLDSKRVWDFAGGGYVHRLVMSSREQGATSPLLAANVHEHEQAQAQEGGGDGEGEEGWHQVHSNRRGRRASKTGAGAGGQSEADMGPPPSSFSAIAPPPPSPHPPLDQSNLTIPAAPVPRPQATKMIEVSGAAGSVASDERPTNPHAMGMSSRQEEAFIHAHLESAAEEFGDVLLQKMRRRRQNFEQQVRNIHRRVNVSGGGTRSGSEGGTGQLSSVSSGGKVASGDSGSNGGGGGGGKAKRAHGKKKASGRPAGPEVWSKSLLRPLIEEKKHGEAKIKRMQDKLRESEEELDVVTRLNEMLRANEQEWRAKVTTAEEAVEAVKKDTEQRKAHIEAQISVLMERMSKMEAAESDAPTGDALQEEHEHQRRRSATGTRGTGRRGG